MSFSLAGTGDPNLEDKLVQLIDNVTELKKHLSADLPPATMTKALNATLKSRANTGLETFGNTTETTNLEAFDTLLPFRPCVDEETIISYFDLEKLKVSSGMDMTAFGVVFPKLMSLPRVVSDSFIIRTAVQYGSLWGVTISHALGFPMDDNIHGKNLMSMAIENNNTNMVVALASVGSPFNYKTLLALRKQNDTVITNFLSQIDICIPDSDIDFIRSIDPETFAFAKDNNFINPNYQW